MNGSALEICTLGSENLSASARATSRPPLREAPRVPITMANLRPTHGASAFRSKVVQAVSPLD